jgi:hypothetical protein
MGLTQSGFESFFGPSCSLACPSKVLRATTFVKVLLLPYPNWGFVPPELGKLIAQVEHD